MVVMGFLRHQMCVGHNEVACVCLESKDPRQIGAYVHQHVLSLNLG